MKNHIVFFLCLLGPLTLLSQKTDFIYYKPVIHDWGDKNNSKILSLTNNTIYQVFESHLKTLKKTIDIDSTFISSSKISVYSDYNSETEGNKRLNHLTCLMQTDAATIDITIFRLGDREKKILGVGRDVIFFSDLLNSTDSIKVFLNNRFRFLVINVLNDTVIDNAVLTKFNNVFQTVFLEEKSKTQLEEKKNAEPGFFKYPRNSNNPTASDAVSRICFFSERAKIAFLNKVKFYQAQNFYGDIKLKNYEHLKEETPFTYHLLEATYYLSKVMKERDDDDQTGINALKDSLEEKIALVKKDFSSILINSRDERTWRKKKANYYELANSIFELYLMNSGSCDSLIKKAELLKQNKKYEESRICYVAFLNKCNDKKATEGLSSVLKLIDSERRKSIEKIDELVYKAMQESSTNLAAAVAEANKNNISIKSRYPKIEFKNPSSKDPNAIKTYIKNRLDLNNLYGSSPIEAEYVIDGTGASMDIKVYLDTFSTVYSDSKISNFPMGQDEFNRIEYYYLTIAEIINDLKSNFGVSVDSGNLDIQIEGSSDAVPYNGKLQNLNWISNSTLINIVNPKPEKTIEYGSLTQTSDDNNKKLAFHRAKKFEKYLEKKGIYSNSVAKINFWNRKSSNLRNVTISLRIKLK